MSDPDDNLQTKIAAALRSVLVGMVEPATIRRAAAVVLPLLPRDTPSAHWERRREVALSRMAQLKASGKGRSAAHLVALELAADRTDPRELEGLAQQIRRWWRERKTNTCADGPPEAA